MLNLDKNHNVKNLFSCVLSTVIDRFSVIARSGCKWAIQQQNTGIRKPMRFGSQRPFYELPETNTFGSFPSAGDKILFLGCSQVGACWLWAAAELAGGGACLSVIWFFRRIRFGGCIVFGGFRIHRFGSSGNGSIIEDQVRGATRRSPRSSNGAMPYVQNCWCARM